MRYLHDGTEYEVAELAKFLDLKANTLREGPIYHACSALLARHERVCADLESEHESMRQCLVSLEWSAAGSACPSCGFPRSGGRHSSGCWYSCSLPPSRTALRGEEAKRG